MRINSHIETKPIAEWITYQKAIVGGVPMKYIGHVSGDPNVAVGKITTAKQMSMPTSNDQLADVAAAGGLVYTGKTVLRLKTAGLMDVTTYSASGAATTQTNVPWPVNGVIYVDVVPALGTVGDGNAPTAAET